jgi:hypothetical protein
MIWDSLVLFALAVPLLLGIIFYLIRPLDRVKPLLTGPREYCDGEGIRSIIGQFRGETVKFTADPYRPRSFLLTIYGRTWLVPESGLRPPFRVTTSAEHSTFPSDKTYTLPDAARLLPDRKRETLELLLGPLGFDWLEMGESKVVLHTSNPSSGMFSRIRIRTSVLKAMDQLRDFRDHHTSGDQSGPVSAVVNENPQPIQGDKS